MYRTLCGTRQTELNTPHIFLPQISDNFAARVPPATRTNNADTKSAGQHTISSRNTSALNRLRSSLHMHQTSRNSQTEVRWHKIVLDYYYFVISIIVFSTTITLRQTAMCHHQNTRHCKCYLPSKPPSRTTTHGHRTQCRVFSLPITTCELRLSHWTYIRVTLRARLQL